jgi:Tol biopolymer transport system component
MFLYVGPNDGLFVANIDGSGERQVTPAGIAASLGGWSPDGSVVVYQADNVGRKVGNVFTVELATGEVTQLTDLEQERSWTWVTDMEPAFGPDGTTVVFHRPRPTDRAWDIWSIPVTGGEPTIVRRNAGWGRYSPDGASLAYLTEFSDSDLSGVIMIADVAAGPGRRLAAVPFRAGPPIWSPDGTRVAYLGSGVRVVDLATGETSLVASCGGPVEWFDDDTLIVGPGGC